MRGARYRQKLRQALNNGKNNGLVKRHKSLLILDFRFWILDSPTQIILIHAGFPCSLTVFGLAAF